MRFTSPQPAGGVIVTVLGPTAIEAIITSFCSTPAGMLIVSVFDPPAPIPRSAGIWVTPEYGGVLEPFVAVFAPVAPAVACTTVLFSRDRKSTRLNSSHQIISYAVFCLKK